MKYKYLISKDDETKNLVIKEYAELDKDSISFVGKEIYADHMIKAAISKGKEALMFALRTPNFFPSGFNIRKIAESVVEFYQTNASEPIEVFFDDVEFMPKDRIKYLPAADIEAESDDIDELIEDDEFKEEEYDKKPDVNKVDTSLLAADEDEDEFEDYDEDR